MPRGENNELIKECKKKETEERKSIKIEKKEGMEDEQSV